MRGRSFLLAAVVAAGFGIAQSASAADMPVKAPLYKAPPMAAYSWTGFYIGAHVGGGSQGSDLLADYLSTTPLSFGVQTTLAHASATGFLGGVQGGYNWQFAPAWVAGVEGDFSWTGMNSTLTVIPIATGGVPLPAQPTTWTRNLKWLASARGRLGFLPMPNLLLYATGGAAWANFDYDASFVNTTPGSNNWSNPFSKTLTGFVVGGGADWKLTQHWILGAEYLYYRFAGTNIIATNPAFPTFPIRFEWNTTEVHVGRIVVSYQFN